VNDSGQYSECHEGLTMVSNVQDDEKDKKDLEGEESEIDRGKKGKLMKKDKQGCCTQN